MQYVSTRGQAPALDFEQVTLAGLAADGGLYVPKAWPSLSEDEIGALAGLPYTEVALRVMRPFVGDSVPEEDLRHLVETAYDGFHHAAVTPLTQLTHNEWLLELFHGPTLAFKDIALQFLGHLFSYFLERAGRTATIIGATSGDTGSAAIDACAGREGVQIFMLHPKDRVSPVQRRQMTTVMAPNVFNIAVEGDFDACQAIVKAAFADADFRARHRLTAVNSINWVRILAQAVYYFYAAVALGGPARRIAFAVPTGNFGDAFAGYVAHRMGLPIAKLIIATNANDTLARALNSGKLSAGTVHATTSPAMDIQVPSNFERLLFEAWGRDGAVLADQMTALKDTGAIEIGENALTAMKDLLAAGRADDDETARAIRDVNQQSGLLVDPHTAVGISVARGCTAAGDFDATVCLATAHAAKFRDVVERATATRPSLPAFLSGLFDREERLEVLPADLQMIKDHIGRNSIL